MRWVTIVSLFGCDLWLSRKINVALRYLRSHRDRLGGRRESPSWACSYKELHDSYLFCQDSRSIAQFQGPRKITFVVWKLFWGNRSLAGNSIHNIELYNNVTYKLHMKGSTTIMGINNKFIRLRIRYKIKLGAIQKISVTYFLNGPGYW